MPIPAPGNVDVASQATLALVKAKTDIIGASVALEAAGNLAAVKAKTDLIPAVPAQQGTLLTQGFTSRLAVVQNRTNAAVINVTIQPPAGQTWVVFVSCSCQHNGVGGIRSEISYTDGDVDYPVFAHQIYAAGLNGARVAVSAWLRITNARYLRVRTQSWDGAVVQESGYTYFGYVE